LGKLSQNMVEDNRDKWSGDHCIDYQHVPAMLLANKPVQNEAPALENIAASVLAEFGIKKPADMTGESIW
jgi:bisphosphoglycerate-independent phosphoglycerate mutase (AlkP superfamily)